MRNDHEGIAPEKIQIIKSCLEESFHDVRMGDDSERVIYNDGQQTLELGFDLEFIDDLRSEKLKEYVQRTFLSTLRANPGKIIKVGASGISIRERHAK